MNDDDDPAARHPGEADHGAHATAEDMPGTEDDFRALAEDWIAIWQSEITAYLTDPETQQAWGAMMAVWAGAAQAMMRGVPPAPGFGPGFAPGFGPNFGQGFGQGFGAGGAAPRPPRRPKPAARADERGAKPGRAEPPAEPSGADAPSRPAPAAAAPVARDDEVRSLEQRVAELERHLAEQDRRRGAAGADRRPRRPARPRG